MFEALINKFESLATIDENQIIHEVLENKDLQKEIIDLNQTQLYDQGVTADGKPTGDYAPATKYHYKPLAAAQGRDGRVYHMTGKDSGLTYDSMKVKNGNGEFEVVADDRNGVFAAPFRYGSLVGGLGLTQDSILKLKPVITNAIIEKLKERIAA